LEAKWGRGGAMFTLKAENVDLEIESGEAE